MSDSGGKNPPIPQSGPPTRPPVNKGHAGSGGSDDAGGGKLPPIPSLGKIIGEQIGGMKPPPLPVSGVPTLPPINKVTPDTLKGTRPPPLPSLNTPSSHATSRKKLPDFSAPPTLPPTNKPGSAKPPPLPTGAPPTLAPVNKGAAPPTDRTHLGFNLPQVQPVTLRPGQFPTMTPARMPKGASDKSPSYPFLLAPKEPDELGRLGSYRILKALGSGGMGMVFHAEDTVLRRPVALKVLTSEWQGEDEGWQHMLREARGMALIKHENLVTLYQAGREGSVFFLAMELLQGESLAERIARGKIEPAEILRMAREMARGLAAIHKNGLIHRDIKPSNIWLEAPEARVRILDFGLARSENTSVSTNLTEQGTIVGTPAFMSPEQARADRLDARSDLFSLGCVLHCMCTGMNPFRGDTIMAQLTALAVDDPVPVHSLNPNVPEALSRIVEHLLAKKPDARPQSAEAVLEELKKIDLNAKGGAHAGAGFLAAQRSGADAAASKPWAKSAVAIGVLLAVGAAALLFSGKGNEETPLKPATGIEPVEKAGVTEDTLRVTPGERRPPPDRFNEGPAPDRFNDGPPPDRERRAPGGRPPPGGGRQPPLEGARMEWLKAPPMADEMFAINQAMGDMKGVYFPEESGKKGGPVQGGPSDAFRTFQLQGKDAPHSIGMHPPPEGLAFIELKIDSKFSAFTVVVSQNDRLPGMDDPVIFTVYGDGKVLWKSEPLRAQRDTQRCSIPVKGVKTLKLEIHPTGSPRAGHMLWFEPYFEK